MAKAGKMVRFEADLMWCNLTKVNSMSNKYQFEACNLSPKAVEALKELGLKPKLDSEKPEKGHFLKIKSVNPITAYDKDGDSLNGILVGNGSKGVITTGVYPWEFKGKPGLSPALKKLVVTNLIEYVGEIDEDDVEDTL